MKRKLFTLLFALVALASFQVNATGPWWIKADTTGLTGNLPYGGNKVSPLPNWLVWTAKDAVGINKSTSILNDGAISKFDVSQVGSNPRLINITNLKTGSEKLKLSYGSNDWTQFEVVQFDYTGIAYPPYLSGIRKTQLLDPTTGIEGYLVPAEGGFATQQDTTPSMLMVVADNDQKLQIVRFDQWAVRNSATYPVFNDGISIITSWPNYNANTGTPQANALNTVLSGLGQATLTVGGVGGYSREVLYVSDAFPVGPIGDFSNPAYTTKYIGTKTNPVDVYADAAGWTNGQPKSYGTDTPTDGAGTSGPGRYCIVVQKQASSATAAETVTVQGLSYTAAAINNGWRPVYIKLEKPAGRWATPADFADCKYHTFGNLSVAKSQKNAPYLETEQIKTFAVTYVDYIAAPSLGSQSDENIFGTGVGYYATDFYKNAVGGQDVGLYNDDGYDSVIPLFTLSSPEANCGVVSISRQNDLNTQIHGDGVYANKLELRDYGHFWEYDSKGVYGEHTATTSAWTGTSLSQERVATSLQKFAFWIDADGNYTMYPAASYVWKYGDPKPGQVSKVLPNSVFLYNNTEVVETTGGTPDQGWGVEIGTWKSGNTTITTTIPNVLQVESQYEEQVNNPKCADEAGLEDISGRFFFLDVVNPGELNGAANSLPWKASRPNAYQDNSKTQYVLSTEVRSNGTKHLIVTPKEKVRGYADANGNKWYNDLLGYKKIEGGELLPDYWSNSPYDSVNMAAHWEIKKTATGYTFVNMLGDVLQYNTSALTPGVSGSVDNLAGGYLPVSSRISDKFNPGSWFGANPILGTGASSEWNASAVLGKEEGVFVLSLNGYTLSLNDTWYQNGVHAKSDSVYFQKDVVLTSPAVVFPWTTMANQECAGGLMLKKSEIYYVPTYSASYDKETLNGVINTNDANFVDGQVKQDSLTAYLLLDGAYGIKEASKVENDLLLGATPTEFGAIAAALSKGGEQVKFISLASTDRSFHINRATLGSAALPDVEKSKETLYGETYKWFVVQLGTQYLVFDTINPNATDERLKVGFTFQTTDVANATPVRLYQPLVGDKLQGNFIFQFRLPKYTYANSATDTKAYLNKWPNFESPVDGGELLFGQLSNQSNFIHGVSERAKATRFTYVWEDVVNTCDGCEQFIAPNWMAEEKVIGFPVKNQIWIQEGASGFSFGESVKGTPGNKNKDLSEAVASRGITKIKHIYVDSIRRGTSTTGGVYTYKVGSNSYNVTGFNNDLDVALYYIQNEDGQYLTVDTTTYQYNSQVTVPDVTGVNLVWRTGLLPLDAVAAKNDRARQLFAITGIDPRAGTDNDGWYTECGTYVYLPLASYKVDYTQGKVIKDALYYNQGLGKAGIKCDNGNDASIAFRVSQYSLINRDQKNLIVANSTGGTATSIVPVEFKWQREAFDQIGCNYQLVQDVTDKDSKNHYYYASGGADCGNDKLATASEYTLLAHWKIDKPKATADPELHTFAPEKALYYDAAHGDAITDLNNQLLGNYYFKITNTLSNGWEVDAYNFTDYYKAPYSVEPRKFIVTCTEHKLPFYDLEEDASYELPTQLAILEAPYVDRVLTDHSTGYWGSDVEFHNNSYQAYLNQIVAGSDIDKAGGYLRAYKVFDRKLGEAGHTIPYYAFSLTKDDGKEYFLNVHHGHDGAGLNGKDSVYWTSLSDADKKKLIEEHREGYQNDFSLYKFCLPYQFKTDGTGELVDQIEYEGITLPRVYLQTLDTAKTDFPYLVVAGSSTMYVTANKLSDVIPNTCSQYWNIYTVDYTKVDPLLVTSWIFAGKKSGDHEWVPLQQTHTADAINPTDVDGLLTNFRLQQGGHAFVSESNESPVNYGVLLGKTQLHFEYQGTEQIGSLWKAPIYYYRVQAPGGGWLTDSYGKTGDYVYTWGPSAGIQNDYQLAYFDNTKLTDNVTGKTYDKEYVQTFGFRYYGGTPESEGDYTLSNQTFVIVSNADYQSPRPAEYRYLAEVNGHLVFVEGIENALLFQFGRDDAGGNYTGIEVAGQAGVVGVQGGVKFLNQTGTASIYSIDGSLIKSVQVTGADQTIAVPRGIVVVKVDGKATKVVVK